LHEVLQALPCRRLTPDSGCLTEAYDTNSVPGPVLLVNCAIYLLARRVRQGRIEGLEFILSGGVTSVA